ncbi:MAG: DUF6671 family protein [Polyangiaceae bacterium]
MTPALADVVAGARRVALLTKHGKERVIVEPFAERLGSEVVLVDGFDTDAFGTFTRDVPRPGSQLDAARAKAAKAMELSGLPRAVASDGAFVPGPGGLVPWNVELVVYVDRETDLEVVGCAQGPEFHAHATVASRDELREFAARARFPSHGLVVRADPDSTLALRKGIVDPRVLDEAYDDVCRTTGSPRAFVEHDLRAHLHPRRMARIAEAVDDLLVRLTARCPRCSTPGFGVVERFAGLPCRDCGGPTGQVASARWSCVRGDFDEVRDLGRGELGDPYGCERCNP